MKEKFLWSLFDVCPDTRRNPPSHLFTGLSLENSPLSSLNPHTSSQLPPTTISTVLKNSLRLELLYTLLQKKPVPLEEIRSYLFYDLFLLPDKISEPGLWSWDWEQWHSFCMSGNPTLGVEQLVDKGLLSLPLLARNHCLTSQARSNGGPSILRSTTLKVKPTFHMCRLKGALTSLLHLPTTWSQQRKLR